jgi:hypothetical protein
VLVSTSLDDRPSSPTAVVAVLTMQSSSLL